MRVVYPSQEQVREECEYREGHLYWRKAKGRRDLTKPIGWSCGKGYRAVNWGKPRKALLVHRLVYIYFHGDTDLTIDHINRDRSDNRIENLRAATYSEQRENCVIRSRKYDLPLGVTIQKGRYKAQLHHQGKSLHLGLFDDPETAAATYLKARAKLGLKMLPGRGRQQFLT